MMPSPAELLAQVPPSAAYALITGLVILESVLVLGSFVPTLGTLMFAGYLSCTGTLELPLVIVCATAGVAVGDLQAQRTGRRLGPGLRRTRLGRKVPAAAWDRACGVVRRRGGAALLVCRFIPVVRTFAPHVAGAMGMPYRRLAPYSLVAGTAWACVESGAGYLAATSYAALPAARSGVLVLVAVGGTLGLIWAVRVLAVRRRGGRGALGGPQERGPEEGQPRRAGRATSAGAGPPDRSSGQPPGWVPLRSSEQSPEP